MPDPSLAMSCMLTSAFVCAYLLMDVVQADARMGNTSLSKKIRIYAVMNRHSYEKLIWIYSLT